MEKENKIKESIINFEGDVHQYRYSSLKKPDVGILSQTELDVIHKVLGKCSNMSATRISAYSHDHLPWQATELYEPINYELVFYRTPDFSVRKYEEDEDN